MIYNDKLTHEQIETMKENRALLFQQIGQYEVQKQYYEQKIQRTIQLIESINDKLYNRIEEQ